MLKRTVSTKPQSAQKITHNWHKVDMKNKVLGRATSEIVKLLTGGSKREYAPYLDCGDYVVVVNARHIKFTGRKLANKTYMYYSGYPGGVREVKAADMRANKPEEVIRRAIVGMLPKNKLRKRRLARLYIYADENHPYVDKVSSN